MPLHDWSDDRGEHRFGADVSASGKAGVFGVMRCRMGWLGIEHINPRLFSSRSQWGINMASKSRSDCVVALAAACVAICCVTMIPIYAFFAADRVPTIVILNNSGQKITAELENLTVTLAPGEISEIGWFHTAESVIALKSADGIEREYKWAPVGSESGFIRGYRIYLQVEGDHCLYLLIPEPAEIVKNVPNQPHGFPLMPQ